MTNVQLPEAIKNLNLNLVYHSKCLLKFPLEVLLVRNEGVPGMIGKWTLKASW